MNCSTKRLGFAVSFKSFLAAAPILRLVDPAYLRVRWRGPLMTEVGQVIGECVVVLDDVRNWQVERRPAFPFRPRMVNGPAAGCSLNEERPSDEIQFPQRHNASPAYLK